MLVDTGGFLPTAAEGRDALVRRQAETAIEPRRTWCCSWSTRTTGVTDLDSAIAQQPAPHAASAACWW